MRKVKMHSGCKGQEDAALRPTLYAPAQKCRCKQRIDYDKANELVKRGEASWVVTGVKSVEVEVDCSVCTKKTEAEKKTLVVCGECKGKGKVAATREILSYNNDIVLLSSTAVDPENKKYRWNTRAKTPRVPTIESKHILRAYVDNLAYASQRIEEYRTMIQEELAEFGAQLRDTKTGKVVQLAIPTPESRWREDHKNNTRTVGAGNPEPANKRVAHPPGSITFKDGTTNKTWWWEHDGRDVDYGRTAI